MPTRVPRPSADQAQRLEADAQRLQAEALRAVLATPEGRRVLWTWIVDQAGLFRPLGFALGGTAATLAYGVGQRDLALQWRAELLAIDAGAWTLMEQEANARDRAYHRQLRELALSQKREEDADAD